MRALHALDEAPWGDWYGHPMNPRDLAKLLRPYGIRVTKVRDGDRSVRGYRCTDFHDAWSRYLPAPTAIADQEDAASGPSGPQGEVK